MDTSTLESKLKWKTPGDPTRFRLYYPPPRAPRGAGEWDKWVAAMLMDMRLNSTDRVVLTRLALHYNLKTGECFPALGRIAIGAGLGESGDRTVRRCLSKAAKLGWIKRTARRGGPLEKNQTNLYELTLPKEICDVLDSIRPTGQMEPPTGQPVYGDRAIDPPITEKGNREVIEHSVSKDTASAASRLPPEKKEGVGEERGGERPCPPRQTSSFEPKHNGSAPDSEEAARIAASYEDFRRRFGLEDR